MSLIDAFDKKNKVVIAAPLAGYTDPPLASVLLPMGVDYMIYPFISSEGVVKRRLYRDQISRRIGEWKKFFSKGRVHVQIFGREPLIMAETASFLETELDVDVIDLNMGCSVKKIWKSNSGSWLLQSPQTALSIIEFVLKAVKIPVTLKTRTGWDYSDENGLSVIREASRMGISAVTLHPRRGKEQFGNDASWHDIKRVTEQISTPVIGNGDILSAEDGKRMIEETGCSGVMIGRGSIGNPWIFKQTIEYIQNGNKIMEPSSNERIETCVRHIEALVEHRGEDVGIRESRKHVGKYLKGLPGATEARKEIVTKDNKEEVLTILKRFKERLISHEQDTEYESKE